MITELQLKFKSDTGTSATTEEWKPIEGLEDYYEISNLGRLRSLSRLIKVRGGGFRKSLNRILVLSLDKSTGYLSIVLYKESKIYPKTIHRLVAIHFIPNPENKPCVNHKDGVKTNNNVKNLEWCTHSENNKHAYSAGLKIAKFYENGYISPLNKPVVQFSENMEFIKNFDSAMDVNRKLGFSFKNICACCTGARKTAFGYIWKRGVFINNELILPTNATIQMQ